MPAEQTDRWPRFTLVAYSRPTGIPNGWDEDLLEHGVPDGLACRAVPQLILLHDADSGPLVGFATHGPSCYLCLEPRTKRVVDIIVDRAIETVNPAYGTVRRSAWLVNSSLDQFIASVRGVTTRFPFDREGELKHGQLPTPGYPYPSAFWDTIAGEWERAAAEMLVTLRAIDAASVANPDGFWMTFIADVQLGSYGTRHVLNPPDF